MNVNENVANGKVAHFATMSKCIWMMWERFIREEFWQVVFTFNRWAHLKDALIDNRSKLGEAQTLQQFSRDADEMENWLQEKLQIASDESYKDPANIQVRDIVSNVLPREGNEFLKKGQIWIRFLYSNICFCMCFKT